MNFIRNALRYKTQLKNGILCQEIRMDTTIEVTSFYKTAPFPNFEDFQGKRDLAEVVEKNIFLIVFTLFITYSCVEKEKVLDNGTKLKYFKHGDGKAIDDGQIVMLNLQYFDHDGNELLNKVGNDPVVLLKDSSWKNNGIIYEVIDNLEKGDSVFFQITTEKFLENDPRLATTPDSLKDKLLSFYCGVENMMDKDEFESFQRVFHVA